MKDHGPFASLFDLMDRDGDGKLYMKEVDAFVDRQTQAARSQMVLSVADQGRAIFAIMDLNRDRHLGVREIRDAVARVSSWDRDGDGRDPLGRDPAPLPADDRPGPDHRRGHVRRSVPAADGVPRRPRRPPPARPGSARWTATATATSPAASSSAPAPRSSASTRDGDGLITAEEAAKTKK